MTRRRAARVKSSSECFNSPVVGARLTFFVAKAGRCCQIRTTKWSHRSSHAHPSSLFHRNVIFLVCNAHWLLTVLPSIQIRLKIGVCVGQEYPSGVARKASNALQGKSLDKTLLDLIVPRAMCSLLPSSPHIGQSSKYGRRLVSSFILNVLQPIVRTSLSSAHTLICFCTRRARQAQDYTVAPSPLLPCDSR
jgi:hypothetical protein